MRKLKEFLKRTISLALAITLLCGSGSVLAQNITKQDVKDINSRPWLDLYSGCGTGSGGSTTGSAPITGNLKQFVDAYGQQAFDIGKKYGIPYEAILAQAMLESGYGKSMLTRKAFNFFGIKAGGSWKGPVYTAKTQEFQDGHYITITASFRSYANAEEGFRGYAEFIHDNSRYKKALNYPQDADQYIKEVAAAGYATSPTYASVNISLIHATKTYIASTGKWPPSSQVVPDKTPPTSSSSSASDGTTPDGCTSADGSTVSGPTIQKIIKIAEQELAKNVHEYDSNTLKYTTGRQEPWCADFVSWVLKEAGVPFTAGGYHGWQIPGVLSMQAWFKAGKNGSTYIPAGSGRPQPGDIGFYIGAQNPDGGGSTEHVNIIIAVSSDGKTMTAIGGNQSDRVTKRVQSTARGANSLAGFGRIKQ